MMEISAWMKDYVKLVTQTFGSRVWFVGLQGSRARGEAAQDSDIDVVLILDEVSVQDLETYSTMLDGLPHRELVCGFLCGKQEILNWDPSDLFQFCYDTLPYVGSLESLLPLIDDAAVARAIKVGAGNLYHGCLHNMLHRRKEHTLRGLYKAAAFTVQAIYFRQTGRYVRNHGELLELVAGEEREILETAILLKKGGAVDFDRMSGELVSWAAKWIRNT